MAEGLPAFLTAGAAILPTACPKRRAFFRPPRTFPNVSVWLSTLCPKSLGGFRISGSINDLFSLLHGESRGATLFQTTTSQQEPLQMRFFCLFMFLTGKVWCLNYTNAHPSHILPIKYASGLDLVKMMPQPTGFS